MNVAIGATEATRDGVSVFTQWRQGRRQVEYVLRSDSPYMLAWLARHAIETLEHRKADLESALKIARG